MSLPNDESVSMTEEASLKSNRDRLMLDVMTSYVLTGVRVIAWIIVSGLLYRFYGPELFVLLSVVRATMAPLTFGAINLGAASIRTISNWKQNVDTEPAAFAIPAAESSQTLDYAHGKYDLVPKIASPWSTAISSIVPLIFFLLIVGSFAIGMLSHFGLQLPAELSINPYTEFRVIDGFFYCAVGIGFGLLFRGLSDALGGILQVQNRLALDNLLCIGAEILFLVICSAQLLSNSTSTSEAIFDVGAIYGLTGVLLLAARMIVVNFDPVTGSSIRLVKTDVRLSSKLIVSGLILTLAQLADLMYAPFAIQFANRFFDPNVIANYSIALMMDAAMLLLVAGISAPLLPRVASAHLAGRLDLIRQYYTRATVVSLAILIFASLVLWASWPIVMGLWLDDVPSGLSIILPLVLIHTAIGGTSGIGRVVLIGMGRFWTWTISSLVGGLSNVLLALIFTLVFDLGIRGIVFATIISVTARCLIWMPWYILRHTKQFANPPKVAAPMADL